MAKLKYFFTRDTLFKVLFTKYPGLLRRLVALLLGVGDIKDFAPRSSELASKHVDGKFCRLDISMVADGRLVDFEVQAEDESNYAERSLFYWARNYSGALLAGRDYRDLPETVIISIVAFKVFRGDPEFRSEIRALEVTRHRMLTPKLCISYFELPKLPKVADTDASSELMLWLALFKAETDEDLQTIQDIGGPIMAEVIEAYRTVTASEELEELERMRDKAALREAAALADERRKARMDVAKGLMEDGVDMSIISKRTGFTADEILGL